MHVGAAACRDRRRCIVGRIGVAKETGEALDATAAVDEEEELLPEASKKVNLSAAWRADRARRKAAGRGAPGLPGLGRPGAMIVRGLPQSGSKVSRLRTQHRPFSSHTRFRPGAHRTGRFTAEGRCS